MVGKARIFGYFVSVKYFAIKMFKKLIIICLPFLNKQILSFQNLSAETKARVISGLIVVAVCFFSILIGGVVYISLIAVGCGVMIYELLKMLSNIEKKNNNTFVLLRRFGILYIIICCLSLILLREFALQGIKISLWLYCVVWSVDVGGYIFGRKYGKLKLAPSISPNKTYEGAILGSSVGLVVSLLIYKCFGTNLENAFSLGSFVFLTLIVVILAQLGDLSESFIKRQCEVKDSGTLIRGHGGFLDRFDSMLIVAPCLYIILFFNNGVLF
jgi:CDP-diglyceride synthetase